MGNSPILKAYKLNTIVSIYYIQNNSHRIATYARITRYLASFYYEITQLRNYMLCFFSSVSFNVATSNISPAPIRLLVRLNPIASLLSPSHVNLSEQIDNQRLHSSSSYGF